MAFEKVGEPFPSPNVPDELIEKYAKMRDYPSEKGTSHIGLHLRFGTVSIRQLAAKAKQHGEVYLNELIWRDFYHMILWHFHTLAMSRLLKKSTTA